MRTIAILLLSIFVASCSDDKKEAQKTTTTPVAVTIATPQQNTSNIFETSGTVSATNTATIKTRLGGFVDKVHVKIGDKVSKGQQLIAINSSDLQAKLTQANSAIATAQIAFDIAEKDKARHQKLLEQQSISLKEYENVSLQYQAAVSQLTAAKEMATEVKANLSYLQIRAPFSGVVTAKYIQKGDLASPGVPLLALEGGKGFEIRTQIPSAKINDIQRNDKVSIFISDLNKTYQGVISEVSPSSLKNGSVFETKVQLTDADEALKSGLFATLSFASHSEETGNKLYISKDALVHKGSLTGVYINANNTAFLRWIRVGHTVGNQVEVISGLTTNDAIISPANQNIKNGTQLIIN